MSDYLHQEIWINIFLRLPVKTLIRIRSICKFFDSIITSPIFITEHIATAKNNQIPLVRYLKGREKIKRKEHYFIIPDYFEYMDDLQEIDFPFKSKCYKHFKVVGSCNGLFCLSDEQDHGRACGIILWNPSIRKYLSLPKPRVCLKSHSPIYKFVSAIGFGFDSQSSDYKVIRIAYANGVKKYKSGCNYPPRPHPEVEIYTVKSRLWRNVNVGELTYSFSESKQTFLEGCVHWPGYISNIGGLITFDMRNESFRLLGLPNGVTTFDSHVTTLGEKLALVEDDTSIRGIYQVWVMEEYGKVESWRKLYTLSAMPGFFHFVGFRNNGNIIGTLERNKLFYYDPIEDRLMNLCTRGAVDSFHMEMYMESLVLLDQDSAVQF